MDKTALRACAGYDPTKRLKATSGEFGTRRPSYLPLEEAMAWFHHYCQERTVPGLIDDSDLVYLSEAGLLIVKASIFLNGELAGKSCGGVFYAPSQAFQTTVGQEVASVAKLRALENAGFGYTDAVIRPEFLANKGQETYQDDIRACSYDPVPDLTFIGGDGDAIPNPYLEVSFRVKWFHQWLKDNKATGYIDDSDVVYYPGPKLLVAKANVYINGHLVGTSCATKPFDPNDPTACEFNPVTYACTQAKGRALINAGFGVMAMGQDDKVGEDPLWDLVKQPDGQPPKAQVPPIYKGAAATPVSEPPAPTAETQAPKDPSVEGTPTEGATKTSKRGAGRRSKKADGGEAQKKEPETPNPTPAPSTPDLPEMPREEALAFIVPFGAFHGKTVGEMLGQDAGLVAFYASDRFKNVRYPDFKRAAIAATKGGK